MSRTRHDPAGHAEHLAHFAGGQPGSHVQVGKFGLRDYDPVFPVVGAVRLFHEHGILVHGMFVAGADTDQADQAGQIAEFARRHDIDTIQIMIETPLPGTRLYDRVQADGRILTGDWSLFDGHHAVMRPVRTDPYQLQASTREAMNRFYSRRGIALPALAGKLHTAPALARLAARGHLATRFPALARLAVRHHWHELSESLQATVTPADWNQLQHAFAVPALRMYGRGQLTRWKAQDRSRQHLAFLAGLA